MRNDSPASLPRRKSIHLPDGLMSCLEWPSRRGATMLFAHANGFNAETYRRLLGPLAGSVHILAGDLRGHGFSTLPAAADAATGWTVFRQDLIGGIRRTSRAPVLLAGHSLGAIACLMAAAECPDIVQALLLIEPVLIPPLRKGDEAGAGDLARRAERRRNVFSSFNAAFRAFHGRGIFASWPDEVLADYLRGGLIDDGAGSLRLACAPRWEAAIFRAAPHDTAPLAAKAGCPITVVVGTKNSSTSESQLDVVRKLRPDARIITAKGASHFVPMEQPDLVREELVRLASLRAGR